MPDFANRNRSTGLTVLKSGLDGLTHVNAVHQVVPGGLVRQVIDQAKGLVFDFLAAPR